MNKYITMLLLGVVIIAMALVLGVHMKQFSGESGDAESAVSSQQETQPQDGAGQTVGAGRLTSPDEGTSASDAAQGAAAGESAGASGSASSSSSALSGTAQTDASAHSSGTSGQAAAQAAGQTAAQTSGSQASTPASTQATAQTSTQSSPQTSAQSAAQTSGQAAAVSAGQSRASGSAQTGTAQNTTGRTGATQAGTSQAAAQTAATQATQPASDKAASVTHGKGSIKTMALKFRGNGMYLLLEGDSALPAKYFLLHDPERLVVDLPGAWKNLAAPAIPSNQLVKSARLGRQSNADRLVIDLSRKLKKHELVRVNDRTVEIVFE